jgi:hypothetical protein
VSLDDRRPRSLSELRELLLGLERGERIDLLRSLPGVEVRAASAEPGKCDEEVGGDGDALVILCGRPGRVRFCGGEVCVVCCEAHACEGSTPVG